MLVVLVVAVAVIYWNFQGRNREFEPLNSNVSLLPPDITRRSTDFEFSQLKGGKPVFKVMAKTSTLNESGEHRLEQVTMLRYDETGTATDAVEGTAAVYRVEQKEIEFEGNVVIHLFDGSKIYADWAGADLSQEVVFINDSFNFEREGLAGRGGSLRYEIPKRVLRVKNDLQLTFDLEGGKGTGRAGTADYEINSGALVMAKGAALEGQAARLSGERITLELTPERKIKTADAFGKAALEAGVGRRFAGDRIRIDLNGGGGLEPTVEVYGPTPAGEGIHSGGARLVQDGGPLKFQLEAARMKSVAGWTGLPGSSEVALKRLDAGPGVTLVSQSLGIKEGHSNRLTALFDETGQTPRSLDMAGNVRLVRSLESPGAASSEEVISSDRLRLSLLKAGLLEGADATGNVSLERRVAEEFQRMTARDAVKLEFNGGLLTRASALSKCVLSSARGPEQVVLRAPRLTAMFRNGSIDQVRGRGGVEVDLANGGENRFSRSEELTVRYREGLLSELIQNGQCRQWQETPSGSLELLSERTRFDPIKKVLVASGETRPVMKIRQLSKDGSSSREFETSASRLVLGSDTGAVQATGSVESVTRLGNSPVVITAGSMVADPDSGWVTYEDKPVLVQGLNLIRGNNIRINRESQELEVLGAVESTLVMGDGADGGRYDVRSQRLSLEGGGGNMLYEGQVVVKSERMELAAPRVVVVFASETPGQFERLEAEGGVEIVEEGRHWKGDKATYFRQEDRVVIN